MMGFKGFTLWHMGCEQVRSTVAYTSLSCLSFYTRLSCQLVVNIYKHLVNSLQRLKKGKEDDLNEDKCLLETLSKSKCNLGATLMKLSVT